MIKAALRSALLMRVAASATALTIWSLSSRGKGPAMPAADQSSMNVDSRLEKYTDTSLIGNATNAPVYRRPSNKSARCLCDACPAGQQ